MHIETLRLYCDVVRHRSFSRGAEDNFVSQSAASQAVAQLEVHLGVTLIDRTKRPFVVTPEGSTFYESCREILAAWDRAKATAGARKTRLDGTVRVAAIYSVGLHDVSRHMQRFMSLHPEARVLLECLHPQKVVEAVLNDEADVGIMSYPAQNRALSVVPLREEPMAFVCHPSHRLARRTVVAAADLGGEPFVAFDPELAIRKAIDRALRHANVRVNVVMAFDNIETIKQAVIIDAGVTILPRHTVQNEVGAGALSVVPLDMDLHRPVGLIHRRQKLLSATVVRFIELLQQAVAEPTTSARTRPATARPRPAAEVPS